MNPNYVAKKSLIAQVKWTTVLLFWTIVPLITCAYRMIQASCCVIEFYDDKIIQKSGVISKNLKKSAFTPVLGVSVQQTMMGRMFNYGNVNVDVVGKWNVNTEDIAKPHALEEFLESRINATQNKTIVAGAQ